jgi:hypothetical protein
MGQEELPVKQKQYYNSGFTLTEIIIASFITLMLMTVVLMVLNVGRRAYDYSAYSFYLTEDTYAATEWIKKDLMQTNLSTIQVYPQKNDPKEPPGISLISAFDPQDGNFKFNDFGRPRWQTHVFYTLVPTNNPHGQGDEPYKVGQLIRWEMPLSDNSNIPFTSTILPSLISNLANKRVILHHVLMPGQDVKDLRKLDEFGGFRISFVRREYDHSDHNTLKETISKINPANINDTSSGNLKTSGNTGLVQVDLVILETSRETGKPNLMDLSFRIKPRN